MTEVPLPVPLTAPERGLIFGLRAIADSPLRNRLLEVVEHLIQIGQEPCCAEAQADGVPCASVHRQCDACAAVFERVQALVALSFPRPAETAQKI
jgi:hypothetical protein